jgi:hypothetical protein
MIAKKKNKIKIVNIFKKFANDRQMARKPVLYLSLANICQKITTDLLKIKFYRQCASE